MRNMYDEMQPTTMSIPVLIFVKLFFRLILMKWWDVQVSIMQPKVPILKLKNYLIISIQWELDDAMALQLQQDVLAKIHETSAKGVLVDLTALDFIDSFIARILDELIQMAGMMGAKVAFTGIQSSIAITLVELGIELRNVITALDLESGLEKLQLEMEG